MEWNYKLTSHLLISTVLDSVVLSYIQSLLTSHFDGKISISTVISLLDFE